MHMLNLILACHGAEALVCQGADAPGSSFLTASTFEQLADSPLPVFAIGGAIAIIAIISSTISKIAVNRSRELTRRELAAYVAEGTLDADKAIEMLKSGRGSA